MKNCVNITDKTQCTGCRACEQLCPVKAISMQEDVEGFIFPSVDFEKCIDCGKCSRQCHMINMPAKAPVESEQFYACKALDESTVMQSSSGGMFSVLAEEIIKKGGAVFGAAFGKDFRVEHICADKLSDLQRLRGSKYVASDTLDTFSQAKKLLDSGSYVLYSGSPCHIAGLKAFLNKEYDRLLTVDIICHGTPSYKIFSKYLGWLRHKMGGEIDSIDFRSKKKGWKLSLLVKSNRKTRFSDYGTDPYYKAFHNGDIYRESCYKCPYADSSRIGDITLGDYWGIELAHPDFVSPNGVSLVAVNTEKGQKFFDSVKDKIDYTLSDFEKAVRRNGNLAHPTERKEKRSRIFLNIDTLDDVSFVKSNLHIPFSEKLKTSIKAAVPYSLKNKLKQKLLK